jgi:hypothetical protein
MGGLKLFGGLVAASIGLIAASVLLPATNWIFHTAYWVGRQGPVDYGDSVEAKLLEVRDMANYGSYQDQQRLMTVRNQKVTDLALAIKIPGALSIAMRTVGQGTTFSSSNPVPQAKKDLAKLQLKLSQTGRDLEPDNSFWPIMESAAWHLLSNAAKEDELFRAASRCPRFDDHAEYEADIRADLLESVRGKLGSQQEVVAYSSILLPHYASIKNLCRYRCGDAPLSKSAERRAEVARFGLTCAKTTTNYIGYFVAIAVSSASVSLRDFDRAAGTGSVDEPVMFTPEQIAAEAPAQAEVLQTALKMKGMAKRLQSEASFDDTTWKVIEDMRPQVSGISLAACLLLTLPVFFLARRLVAWRESEVGARASIFLPSLVASFAGVMAGAHLGTQGLFWALLVAASATIVSAMVSLVLKSNWALGILIGLHALTFLCLGTFAKDHAPFVLAATGAATLPLLMLWVRKQPENVAAAVAWTGWLIWTAALIHGATTHFVIESDLGFESQFEPALSRLTWLAFCAIVGGLGAGALSAPGAKGLWRQAVVVQGLLLIAFLGVLGFNISRDKTMAKFLGHEKESLRVYQSEIQVPPAPESRQQ